MNHFRFTAQNRTSVDLAFHTHLVASSTISEYLTACEIFENLIFCHIHYEGFCISVAYDNGLNICFILLFLQHIEQLLFRSVLHTAYK